MKSNRQLRDEMAADYVRNARRLGANPSFEDAQKVAAADLELVEVTSRQAPPPKDKTPTRKPTGQKAAELAAESGAKFVRREIKDESPIVNPADIKRQLSEKALALVTRYKEVLARAPMHGSKNLDQAGFLFPALAKDALEVHANYTLKRRGYRGLNEVDRQRKFWRDVEDICDRSTGVLGPWWVR